MATAPAPTIYSPMQQKTCSKCGRVLPASAFNKAKWLASGLRSDCKECYKETKAKYWAARPPSDTAKRHRENQSLALSGRRRCKCCGQVQRLDQFHQFPAGYLETTCRACVTDKVRRWTAANRERIAADRAARCAKRYAAKRSRTPPWLSPEHLAEIRGFYIRARNSTKETGILHHVDHIEPLLGRDSCGLHVPWNLQVLTGSENCKKSNKLTTS